MNSSTWRTPIALLVLMSIAMPIAFNTWTALLNNFVVERAAFGPLVLAGVLALIQPVMFELFAEAVLGWVLVAVGLVRAFTAWRAGSWSAFITQLAFGILVLLAGGYLLWNPVGGLVSLTIVLTAFMLVEGISKLVLAYQSRGHHRAGWVAVSGIASLLVGMLILANLQTAWSWAIGVLLGIDLLFGGVSALAIASAARANAARTA